MTEPQRHLSTLRRNAAPGPTTNLTTTTPIPPLHRRSAGCFTYPSVAIGTFSTKRWEIEFSRRNGLTATMADAGALPTKHEKSAKLSCSPLVRAWKARRSSSVMLIMANPVWRRGARERRGGLARAHAPRPATASLRARRLHPDAGEALADDPFRSLGLLVHGGDAPHPRAVATALHPVPSRSTSAPAGRSGGVPWRSR